MNGTSSFITLPITISSLSLFSESLTILATVLTILYIVGESKEDTAARISINKSLFLSGVNEMIKHKLILYDDANDIYSLNQNFKNIKKDIDVSMSNVLGESEIDIRINYKDFFEGKLDFNINTYQKKIGIKHQRMIIQCYIMKFLKQNKEKKNNDFNSIMEYLQKNLPLIGKMNLDNEELNENLKILNEKLFITSTSNNNKEVFYHYS